MINLNDSKFNDKIFITEEAIFETITDYDVFNHYIDDLDIHNVMSSPVRKDSNPSFSVFWSKKNDRLLYKDFGTGESGSCIKLVMELLNLDYRLALEQVIIDFSLTDKFIVSDNIKKSKDYKAKLFGEETIKKIKENSTDIQITVREWASYDLKYWNSYGITLPTLMKYNVFPVIYIFINGYLINAEKHAYAYMEMKDGVVRYKIYQPFSKGMKWINNLIEGTLSGFSQLPEFGELLIIASSLKDGMCIHEMGFHNILAPQTENYIFKEHIIQDLIRRFNKIIIFYDHDKAGVIAANKMTKLYNLKSVTTGFLTMKDPSDYYKKRGSKRIIKLLKDI